MSGVGVHARSLMQAAFACIRLMLDFNIPWLEIWLDPCWLQYAEVGQKAEVVFQYLFDGQSSHP